MYGQKQAGKVWNDHITQGLKQIGFEPSKNDPCVYYKGTTIFLLYVDDGIFLDPSPNKVNRAIEALRKQEFELEDQGSMYDYLGINYTRQEDGTIIMTQPQLINEIIAEVETTPRNAVKPTPCTPTKVLHRHMNAPLLSASYNYRSVIGKLNYLEKGTRPDIAYATHQLARFSVDPRVPHGEALEYLLKYLRATRDRGIIMKPDANKQLEAYADADFSGNWNAATAAEDAATSKSRTGFIILFAGCPIFWTSKLQTITALSTTEAEYVALSHALREVIPIINILEELKQRQVATYARTPRVYCKAYEDNSATLEIATVHKFRPRTKHINLAYHHFREYVRQGKIMIHPIDTKNQLADIFTKPLQQNDFTPLRRTLLYW